MLDHHNECEVETLEEGYISPTNSPLTTPICPPIVELPSTRYIDHFARYRLPYRPLPWSEDPISSTPVAMIIFDLHSQVAFPICLLSKVFMQRRHYLLLVHSI